MVMRGVFLLDRYMLRSSNGAQIMVTTMMIGNSKVTMRIDAMKTMESVGILLSLNFDIVPPKVLPL